MKVIYDNLGPRVIICNEEDQMVQFYLEVNKKAGYQPQIDSDGNWYVKVFEPKTGADYEHRESLQWQTRRDFQVQ